MQVIGKVKKGPEARVLSMEGKKRKELKPLSRDEILKIFELSRILASGRVR
jgi:hypothetical protein